MLHAEQEDVLSTEPYLTCRELIDFIDSYRDHELTSEQRTEFERHLAVCPSCVAYLNTYEQAILLARSAANEQAPENVPESLVRAILAAREKS